MVTHGGFFFEVRDVASEALLIDNALVRLCQQGPPINRRWNSLRAIYSQQIRASVYCRSYPYLVPGILSSCKGRSNERFVRRVYLHVVCAVVWALFISSVFFSSFVRDVSTLLGDHRQTRDRVVSQSVVVMF